MDWLIFFGVVAVYWIIAIKKMPGYFRFYDAEEQRKYPNIYNKSRAHTEAAWFAIGVGAVWPFYEGGIWLRDRVIHVGTAEEREREEYEKAEKIVEDYKLKQELEAKEAFKKEGL